MISVSVSFSGNFVSTRINMRAPSFLFSDRERGRLFATRYFSRIEKKDSKKSVVFPARKPFVPSKEIDSLLICPVFPDSSRKVYQNNFKKKYLNTLFGPEISLPDRRPFFTRSKPFSLNLFCFRRAA